VRGQDAATTATTAGGDPWLADPANDAAPNAKALPSADINQ
jgi:hypothetical protein